MAATTVRTQLQLDASDFSTKVKDAKASMDDFRSSAGKIADELNASATAEAVNAASVRKLRNEYAEQRRVIQDCAAKMIEAGEAAKNTAGYQKLVQEQQAAVEKGKKLKEALDRVKGSLDELDGKKVEVEVPKPTALEELRKSYSDSKREIQECEAEMIRLGDAAKDTAGYQKLVQQQEAARKKCEELKQSLDRVEQSVDGLNGKKAKVEVDAKVPEGPSSPLQALGKKLGGIDLSGIIGKFGSLGSAVNSVDSNIGKAISAFQSFRSASAAASAASASSMAGAAGAAGEGAAAITGMAGAAGGLVAALGPVVAGVAAVIGVVGALKQALGAAVEASAEFEQSMANLGALTGQSGDALENMRDKVVATADATKTADADVAKMFESIGSQLPFLLKDADGMQQVADAAILLKKASGMDAASAVESLTSVMQQFGLNAEDAARVVDVLSAASVAGAATQSDVAESMNRCGVAARNAGLDYQETAAAIETLSLKGIKGEKAGTALRNVFSKMGTGADELNPKVVGMAAALDNLSKKRPVDLKNLFGEEGMTAAQILADDRDKLADIEKQLGATGVAAEQAAQRGATLKGSLTGLQNTWNNFLASFSTSDGLIGGLLTGVVQGVTSIISALKELVHAFDPIFATDWNDKLGLNPWRDLGGIIGDVIQLVAKLVYGIVSIINLSPKIQYYKAAFTAVSVVLKVVREILDAITLATRLAIAKFKQFAAGVKNDLMKVPGLDHVVSMLKTIKKLIDDAIDAWRRFKKNLGDETADAEKAAGGGGGGTKGRNPDQAGKNPEKKDTSSYNYWSEQYEQLVATQKTAQRLSKQEYEKRKREILKNWKKSASDAGLSWTDPEGGSKTKTKTPKSKTPKWNAGNTRNDAQEGSNQWLQNQRSNYEQSLRNGKSKDDAATAARKLDELDERIRKSDPLYDPKSIEGMQSDLDALKKRYAKGLVKIAPDDYDAQVRALEKRISDAKAELHITAAPGSLNELQNELSRLNSDLADGKLQISTDEAYAKVKNLESKIRSEKMRLGLEFPPGSFQDLQRQLDQFTQDYEMNIIPGIDPKTYKKMVEGMQKQIESKKIEIGVSLSLDDADKEYGQLQKDFEKKRNGGSSFNQAVGNRPFEAKSGSKDDRLAAIEAQMDANDALMEQLDRQAKAYEKLGDAGADGYKKVEDQVASLKEQQAALGDSAKTLDKSNKKEKKMLGNTEKIGNAVGSLGDAFSSLGGAFEVPELDVAGIIAQSLANLALSTSQAIEQSTSMGPWGWVAFSAAAMAQLAAMAAQIHQATSHASGGIIGGGHPSGDKILARLNSGEMILNQGQQGRLFRLLSGDLIAPSAAGGGNSSQSVEFVLRGADLYSALRNYSKIQGKNGNKISLR